MVQAVLDPEDGVRKIIAFDLDGTLANIDHRTHFVKRDKPDWDAFNKACVYDKPNAWAVKMINELAVSYGVRLIIVSARSKVVEAETRDWLNNNVTAFLEGAVELAMLREPGDTTEDVELKMRWLESVGGAKSLLMAVDDRQKVVDAWRAAGVVCLQAYAWPEFNKHTGRG